MRVTGVGNVSLLYIVTFCLKKMLILIHEYLLLTFYVEHRNAVIKYCKHINGR